MIHLNEISMFLIRCRQVAKIIRAVSCYYSFRIHFRNTPMKWRNKFYSTTKKEASFFL